MWWSGFVIVVFTIGGGLYAPHDPFAVVGAMLGVIILLILWSHI